MKKSIVIAIACVCAVTLIWCGSGSDDTTQDGTVDTAAQQETMMVQNGDMVSVNYIWTSNGELFDTSIANVAQDYDAENPDAEPVFNEARTYEPLTFEVWAGQMIPGFDNWVVGMQEWETKTLTLEPSEAYGERNDELIQTVPLETFADNNLEIEVGETYNFWFTQWTVLEIDEDLGEVVIDFNPRLAGQTLVFEVTVEDIQREQAVVE